jgi:hypothetical protein
MDAGTLVVYLVGISTAGEQVAENLWGGFVKGPIMRYLAIVTTIGIAYAAWALDVGPLEGLSPIKVAVYGVFAGLGSNVIHSVFGAVLPGTRNATLSGAVAQVFQRQSDDVPPSPPRR